MACSNMGHQQGTGASDSGTLPTGLCHRYPAQRIHVATSQEAPLPASSLSAAAQADAASSVQGCISGTWMKSKTSYMTAVMSSAGVSAGSSGIVSV